MWLVQAVSNSKAAQAVVGKWVMKADWWFTTPAVIFQPLSGLWMLHYMGMPFTWDGAWLWVKWTLALYALAGACWLPVGWAMGLALGTAFKTREDSESSEGTEDE